MASRSKKKSKKSKTDSYSSVLVVLGNRLQKNGHPSAFLLSRIEFALDLLRQKSFDKLLLVGGPTAYPVPEAEVMAPFFFKAVPKKDILLESRSLTTLQNAVFSWEILKDKPVEDVTIITSDFHIPKARYVFRKIFAHTGFKLHFIPVRSDVSVFSRLKHRLIAYYGILHDFFVLRKNKKAMEL